MQDLSRPLPAELADFFFQPDDRYQLDGCVTALTRDGLNVAVLSSHAAALEHYGALLLTRLRKFTPTSKIEPYFRPVPTIYWPASMKPWPTSPWRKPCRAAKYFGHSVLGAAQRRSLARA